MQWQNKLHSVQHYCLVSIRNRKKQKKLQVITPRFSIKGEKNSKVFFFPKRYCASCSRGIHSSTHTADMKHHCENYSYSRVRSVDVWGFDEVKPAGWESYSIDEVTVKTQGR